MLIACLISMALITPSCGAAPTKDWAQLLRAQACPDDVKLGQLLPRDRIQIRVFGEDDLSGEYEITPASTLMFPLIGEVKIENMGCDDLSRELTKRLGAQYLRNPHVTCLTLSQTKTIITVDGMVQKPGSIEFRSKIRLTDAIAQSGGLTVRAASNSVVITRKNDDGTTRPTVVPYQDIVEGEETYNPCLFPGDIIFVPEVVF